MLEPLPSAQLRRASLYRRHIVNCTHSWRAVELNLLFIRRGHRYPSSIHASICRTTTVEQFNIWALKNHFQGQAELSRCRDKGGGALSSTSLSFTPFKGRLLGLPRAWSCELSWNYRESGSWLGVGADASHDKSSGSHENTSARHHCSQLTRLLLRQHH